ncbi:hypothetical protein H9W90_10715 [Polaribacter pectinis]|uniref:Lipoprotein n=1 Tax=Polaribacter pectinis TaxID=2738844 RepID=A0A7G9L7R9_9FLAO|nr:DUF6252 family protein [Polaribacter pectinis]QNM84668.1 hypothetical protein H9W90_10715 [Polaribacter pectinis]
MKTLQKILLFISATVLISCSATDNDLGVSGEGSFSAKVNGEEFISLSVSVGATVANNVLAVQGSKSSGEFIRLNIMNYTGVGTYKTGDAVTNASSMIYGTINPVASWTSTFNIGSGTVIVTEETATTVTGTFSFEGVNTNAGNKTITEGKFSAPKS